MEETNPASLLQQISKFDKENLPPVHLWNPPLCKNVEMKIDREGRWYFMNSPIGRERMVKLFSKVLRFDEDGEYYLVTPVEKIRIEVEERPFVIVNYELTREGKNQIITFETNTGDLFLLDEKHPVNVQVNKETLEPKPYVLVRSNLEGIISRNIYYKLIEISKLKRTPSGEVFIIRSNNQDFQIGSI